MVEISSIDGVGSGIRVIRRVLRSSARYDYIVKSNFSKPYFKKNTILGI